MLDPEAPDLPDGSLLLADEIDMLCPTHGYAYPWVKVVVHYGRHLGITLVGCTRRPANVNKDITALVDIVCIGHITEPADLDYCIRSWGRACADVGRLQPYSFLSLRP